jgi:riboflavin kinase / FMN adenylyltransferase
VSAAGDARSMTVVHGLDALEPSLGRLFLVIGVFDGLHLGHQYLLGHLVREAGRLDARPTVLTFDHHPDEVLTGKAPPLLCDPEERLVLLEAAGVEVTIVQTFDVALRETPYEVFVRRIADKVDLAGFLMTPESAFGFERRGTPETVAALGRELGYEVVVVPPFTLDGAPVTSSAIRTAIGRGDLADARRFLGRPVGVVGTVARATRDATEVVFPLPVALPPPGRYEAAVRSPSGSLRHRELILDGDDVRLVPPVPTVTGGRLTIEVLPLVNVREPRSAATIRRS